MDLIEFDTEMGDDRKQHHIIRLREIARAIMLKDNQIVYTTPPRLPMIVEPKPYKWNDNNIELGGYLNNDILDTSDLFIDKIGYRDCTKLKKENHILDLINGVSCVPYKINKEVLEFIKVSGVEKGIILNYNNDELNNFMRNPYRKSTKKLNKELRSLRSSINF